MASTEAKTAAALLISFSAVIFLLLAREALLRPPALQQQRRRGALADLLLAALDRFLDGRGLLDLATRRNMLLLCHAILALVLMDAGVLGARPAGAEEGASSRSAPASPAPHAAGPGRSVVVWRRRRSSRAAARRMPRGPEVAAPWAAAALAGPAVTTEPEEPLVAAKQMIVVDKAPRSYLLDGHDRAAVAELGHQAPAIAAGRSRTGYDHSIIGGGGGDGRNGVAEAEETEGVELADDRRIEEFIEKQWSKMRQESLQLVRASVSQQRSITAC